MANVLVIRGGAGFGSVLARRGLIAASRGIDRVPVAIAAEEMDDKPDDSDEDEQRGEGNEKPEGSRQDRAGAMNRSALSEIGISGDYRGISPRRGLLSHVEIATEDDDIPADLMAGVNCNASEEDGHVTAYVSMDLDGAKHADDVTGVLALRHSDITAKADTVVVAVVAPGEG